MSASGISGIAIGAIVKEDSTTLLEWIAYHRVIGVKYFWVADNGCGAAARSFLMDLDRLGIVNYIYFPSNPGDTPQLRAYKKIIECTRDFGGVIAFIDVDEFLVPDGETLLPFIDAAFRDESVSAVALNWSNFGSSGALFAEDGLVIERFTRRARQSFSPHYNFKSIVRPERVYDFANPHCANLRRGRYADAAGKDLVPQPHIGPGVSAEVVWKGARIHHYAVKSLEEFLLGKHLRGSAATPNRVKNREYFTGHDKNDEECLLAARFAPLVHEEIARLQTKRDYLHPAANVDQQPHNAQQSDAGCGSPADNVHTGILQEKNLELHRLLDELSIAAERLFRSGQYRVGSTVGTLLRTLLGRAEKRSWPEIQIRRAVEQYKRLGKIL